MATRQSPTVLRRRLGIELRKLRQDRALTGEQVAAQLGWSESKVSRLETARVAIQPGDVMELSELYGLEGDQREALVEIARKAKQRGWWHPYSDVLPDWFSVYIGLESEATVIRTYEAQLVPGLLQTADYARAVLRAAPVPDSPAEVDRKVALRVARQQLLGQPNPPQLWAILHEAVIRQKVGDAATMRDQLKHVLAVAQTATVMLQVLPFGAGAHAGMDGSFVVLELPRADDPKLVYLDILTGSMNLVRPREIDSYTLAFEHLRAAALGQAESARLIESVAEEHR